MSAFDPRPETTQKSSDRRPWRTPTVTPAGTIAELLQQGGGKPSLSTADPGEPRKVGHAG